MRGVGWAFLSSVSGASALAYFIAGMSINIDGFSPLHLWASAFAVIGGTAVQAGAAFYAFEKWADS